MTKVVRLVSPTKDVSTVSLPGIFRFVSFPVSILGFITTLTCQYLAEQHTPGVVHQRRLDTV